MQKRRNVLALSILLMVASTPNGQKPPESQALEKVNFPSYQARKLENGLTVYALEYREQPVVAMRLVIGAGAANDPKELPGLASFTAGLLDQGTAKRRAQQIAEAIDFAGGSLEAGAERESIYVSATVLADTADLGLDLMTDIVINPAFADEEIQRQKQMAISALAASMRDPDFLADVVFERVLYGAHPYAHPDGGTLASIPRIRREDIVKFHQSYFAPNISSLAIVGDLSTNDAFALAEKWFGKWERKDVPRPEPTEIPAIRGRRIVIIDKPDSVQTVIRIGHLGVPRKHPDYFNLLTASYILGGGSTGRLFQSLRTEKGLTYGAYSTIRPRKGPGTFYALTETRTEKTAEAIQAIFDEIGKLRANAVPEQELKDTQAFLIGSFPLSIETPADLAARLTNVAFYELGDDYLNTYRDKLAAVTSADVLNVARIRIVPEHMAIVLVGKAAGFQKDVAPLGNVRVIPVARLDLGSPDLQKTAP